jgi:hypothetical protein
MKKTFLAVSFVLIAVALIAQDRYFGRTYTTNILPKGNFDIELWHTSRFGHEDEYFHAMDQRFEYEVGLGGNVQTAFYFNRYQTSVSDSTGEIHQFSEIGFSNEWKWKVTKPTSELGTALYAELGVKGDELELETKLILDRSFGKSLIAFNTVYELEWEAAREQRETKFELAETPLELDLAYMYNLSTSFGAGIEVRDYNQITKGSWEHSVLFCRPYYKLQGKPLVCYL